MTQSQPIRGYRKKPWWINAIAFTYLLIPCLTLYQYSRELGHSSSLVREIIFTPSFLTELFCSVTAALAVFTVTRAGFFYFIALSLYTIGTKLYNLKFHGLFEYPLDFVIIAFWFLATSLLLLTTLRIPYLNPRSRWWTQPPRYQVHSPGILFFESYRFPVVTLDLSEGGIFIKLDERALAARDTAAGEDLKDTRERRVHPESTPFLLSDQEMEEAKINIFHYPGKIGSQVKVRIQTLPEAQEFFEASYFESEAEVVWAAKVPSSYRYGLGLRFQGMKGEEKKSLKKYIKLLQWMSPKKSDR